MNIKLINEVSLFNKTAVSAWNSIIFVPFRKKFEIFVILLILCYKT
jgi:hypothetical protein